MEFTLEKIVYFLVTTFMMVALILDHADAKNATFIEMAATEAILKAPPSGYVTPEVQQGIKDFLAATRGMSGTDITIEGTTDLAMRKIRGSSNENIELTIKYPRKVFVFFGGVVSSNYTAKRVIQTDYVNR